ncbi:MAG TPA: permease [Thermotogota bacterium]|nr:permease [Thermotogota bacterium]HPR97655.1 permease [Thermotogota bacterium]
MTTIILIAGALVFFFWSLFKDRKKTKEAFRITRGMFTKTIVQIIGVLALISLFLAIVPPEMIKTVMGSANEQMSIFWGSLIGTITIIPAFVAFPLSKSLLDAGAALTAIAAFLTTLTMVGFATFPIEREYFGTKFTIYRNLFSFFAAIFIALIMGVIL